MTTTHGEGEIRVVTRSNPEYNHYVQLPSKRMGQNDNTPFYDNVVRAINAVEPDDILLISIPHGIRYTNLRKVLFHRGFTEEDVEICRQQRDPAGNSIPGPLRPMRVKKLREVEGKVLNAFED